MLLCPVADDVLSDHPVKMGRPGLPGTRCSLSSVICGDTSEVCAFAPCAFFLHRSRSHCTRNRLLPVSPGGRRSLCSALSTPARGPVVVYRPPDGHSKLPVPTDDLTAVLQVSHPPLCWARSRASLMWVGERESLRTGWESPHLAGKDRRVVREGRTVATSFSGSPTHVCLSGSVGRPVRVAVVGTGCCVECRPHCFLAVTWPLGRPGDFWAQSPHSSVGVTAAVPVV